MIYVHPYDSENTIYGQATVGYELDEQFSEDIEAVLVPQVVEISRWHSSMDKN